MSDTLYAPGDLALVVQNVGNSITGYPVLVLSHYSHAYWKNERVMMVRADDPGHIIVTLPHRLRVLQRAQRG